MATKQTYLTIPHPPGLNSAGVTPLGDLLPARTRGRLLDGERVGVDFLAGVTFRMIKERGNELTDFLYIVEAMIVASERVVGFLRDQRLTNDEVEYLPIKLKNKKGKAVAEKYFVVNPFLRVACLDPKKSDCELFENPVSGEKS